MDHIAQDPEASQQSRLLQKVLRLPDVLTATGLSQSTIYAKVADGTFPKPIQLTDRAVGWLESEIIAWQTSRMAQREGAAA